jgi:hypothetical protein
LDRKLNRGTKLGFYFFSKTEVPKKKNLKTQIPNMYLTLKLNFQFYAQWVGSNGKGICLGSIPIGFKVWIPLSANNSLGQWSWSLTRSLWRGHFAWVQIYLTWVGTRSDLELEGFLSLKQKSNFITISLGVIHFISLKQKSNLIHFIEKHLFAYILVFYYFLLQLISSLTLIYYPFFPYMLSYMLPLTHFYI